MTGNLTFWRKVSYFAAMAVLLIPLSCISRPSTRSPDGRLTEGGTLSQLRREYGLSQAELGDIDPASESMKLATLGMRGIAANILWEKANYYKKTEDWDSLKATLNQITKLQPNFIAVWRFQAWNMSYNVSVEFDDYRHRYHWVKKGIDFLIDGTRYNRDEPRLLWDIGWFFGHKIGRSDEKDQFRRMFREDDDFHKTLALVVNVDDARGPYGRPDNWLVGRQWYLKGQRVVDTQGVPVKGMSELIFHSHPPMALMKYAEAIEEEGWLDEMARLAWEQALVSWKRYGNRDIPTSFGFDIRLNDAEPLESELEAIEQQLDQLDEDSPEARRLAARKSEIEVTVRAIHRYREIVNFEYWQTRCEAERQETAIKARKYVYQADLAYDDARLVEARDKYEQAWEQWAKIFDQYPVLLEDVTAEDLMDAVNRYRELLGQLDEKFPPPGFKLSKLVAIHDKDFRPPDEGAESAPDEAAESVPDEGAGGGPDDNRPAEPGEDRPAANGVEEPAPASSDPRSPDAPPESTPDAAQPPTAPASE